MSIIWNCLKNIYVNIDDFIREEIPIHFFVAVSFILLWTIIIGLLAFLIYISIMNWKIGAWILGGIIGFEILCALGKYLMR